MSQAQQKKGTAGGAAKGAGQYRDGKGRGAGAKGQRSNNNSNNREEIEVKLNIPKVAKPDREKIRAEMDAMKGEKTKINNELKDIQRIIDTKAVAKKNLLAEQQQVKDQLKALNQGTSKIREERKKIFGGMKSMNETRQRKFDELKQIKEKLPFKIDKDQFNLERILQNIDLEISKLERSLKTTQMTLPEEKKIIAEIGTLTNSKKVAKEYDQLLSKAKAAIDSDKPETAKLRQDLKEQEDELRSAKDQEAALRQSLETIRLKIQDNGKDLPDLFAKRDGFHKRIGEMNTRMNELRKTRDEQEVAYEGYMKQYNEAYKEEKKKHNEKRAVERAEREKEKNKERLNEIPFEEELNMCDRLIAYLEGLLPKEDVVTTTAATTTSDGHPAPDATVEEGVVVHKKTDEEEPTLWEKKNKGKGKQPQKKQRNPVVRADATLKHQWDVFAKFEKLSLLPPVKINEIEKAIQDLKGKKVHYTKLGEEKLKQLAELVAKQAAEDKAKGEATPNTSEASTSENKEAEEKTDS